MAQIKTTIGKVGFVFKDQWVEGKSYDRLDIVSYNGGSYVSLIDNNDSSIENNTKWRLLVTKGENGKAVYFHIRYSNDGGKTFTGNNGKDVGDWLGTYSDNISDDSTQISSYTWVKIKGNQGDPGKTPLFSVGVITTTVNPTVSLSSDGNDVNGNPKFLINFGLQKGEKGDKGDGFKIMGYYPSLDALKATIISPNTGDIYGIGTASPYDIYVFDGITNQWINNGSIQGAKGDDALINGYNTLTITGGENISVTQDGSTLNISSDMVASNYISKTNTTEYTPINDYNPSTKKYVDDKIGNIDFSVLENQINSNTALIGTKADSSDVYTKSEVDTKVSNTLQLGETSTTAYRGDRGKTAYDHSQVTNGNPHKVTKSDIGLENVDNTADSSKSVKYSTSSGSTTNDSDGLQINTTYIKGLSVNGKTITYTKGDNKTGTLITQDTTYSAVSQTANGLMSSTDKIKLDGIAEGANNYTHPSYTAKSSGLYKITVDSTGHISATTSVTKSDITGLGVPASDTTYSNATTSINGLMSSEDKTKLDSISSGAEVNQNAFGNVVIGSTTIAAGSKTDSITLVGNNVTITPDATNDKVTIGITKTNVTDALGYTPPTTNTTYSVATASTSGLMSNTDKAKLDKIAEDATKVTIDSSLSNTSTNPVQNKIINAALSGKSDTGHTHDDRYYTETEIDSKLKDLLDVNDAMIFKGVINSATSLPSTHKVGWTYRVGEIGTYAGVNCELGDLVICITDGTTSDNSHWTVAQTNIDGAVVGPSSSTDTNIVIFNGTTGHVIKDSGKKISDFAASGHTHTIVASATNDDVIVLTGVNGTNSVSYTASHANSGVSAGTYKSVTVDTKGHITAGTNPTTLSGYGITDAKKVQAAVTSPTANGNSLSFIDTISQNTQGVITATKKNITIDSTLSSTSTNPVQNKVINAALSSKIEDAPSDSNEYVRKDGAWIQSNNKEIYKLPYSLFELTSSSTETDFLAVFGSTDNFIQLVKNANNYIFCINETRAETNSASSTIVPLDVNAYFTSETTYYYMTFGFYDSYAYNLIDIIYGENEEGTLAWITSGVQYTAALTLTNTNSYTPTSDYNPATKKYVDDNKFSGNYSDLIGTPTIPTKTSDLVNDNGFLTSHQDISGKQDKLTDTQLANLNEDHSKYLTSHQSLDGYVKDASYVHTDTNYTAADKALVDTITNKANAADLATVATSGSYSDLSNRPVYSLPNAIWSLKTTSTVDEIYTAFGGQDKFDYIRNNYKDSLFYTWANMTAQPVFTYSLLGLLFAFAVYYTDLLLNKIYLKQLVILYSSSKGPSVTAITTSNILTTNNTLEYSPVEDYNPATKKYVDDTTSLLVYKVPYTLLNLTSSSTSDDILAVFGSVDNFKYIVNNASTLAIIISKAASDSDGVVIQNIPTQFYGYCLNVSNENYYVGKFDYFDIENNSIKLIGIQLIESTSTFSVQVLESKTVATQDFVTNKGYLTASQVQALIDASVKTVLNTSV